jgi:hypothetical protein
VIGMKKDDIELLPADEVVDAEDRSAEEDAVHPEPDEAHGAGSDEADAADVSVDDAEPDEHEEDLEEILKRHYGIIEDPAAPGPPDDEPRELGPDEFACRSCFTRRSTSQLAVPAGGTCVDCGASA